MAIRTAPAAFPSGDRVFVAFQARGSVCPNSECGDLTVLKIAADNRLLVGADERIYAFTLR